MHDLVSFKKAFDPRLALFLEKKKKSSRVITRHPMVGSIVDHAVRISLEGGKRIRPYLGYLGYTAAGGEDAEEILDACIGLELFHIFALIHDDIIDRAPTRRGVPTVHAHIEQLLHPMPSAKRKGISQAILAGDLVYAWSHEALFSALSSDRCDRVRSLFYAMIEEVILGEMIDVDIADRSLCSHRSIEEKNLLKTARYTFVHPLKIGAMMHRGNTELDFFFESFGEQAGTAFQMQDDLLDVIGDPKKTGKPKFGDVRESQHTHLTDHIHAHGTAAERKILTDCFGARLNAQDKKILSEVFVSSGAVAWGEKAIGRKMHSAKRALSEAPLPLHARKAFNDLVESLVARSA